MTNREKTAAGGLDPERLAQGLAMIRAGRRPSWKKETGVEHPVTLDHLLARAGPVPRRGDRSSRIEEVRPALLDALKEAHGGLMKMKKAEGAGPGRRDASAPGHPVRPAGEVVQKLAPQAAVEIQTRLEERLAKMLTDQLDPQRLAQEVALLADKANINEESSGWASTSPASTPPWTRAGRWPSG